MASPIVTGPNPIAAETRRPGSLWTLVQVLITMGVTFALAGLQSLLGSRPTDAFPTDEMAIWSFLAAFASATVLLLILMRKARQTRLVEAAFLVAVFAGIGSLLHSLFGSGPAILGTSFAVYLYYRARSVLVFNLLLAMGCAGVSANLGRAMQPAAAAVILAFLAVYDIVAVYVTKHMVEMAEAMLRRKVFFAIILSERPAQQLLPVTAVSRDAGFTFLGTGDLVLPALFVASVALVDARAAVFVGAGALLGATALYFVFLSQKQRSAMPALPPIATGALLGYLAALVL